MVLSFIPVLRQKGAASHPCAKPLKEKAALLADETPSAAWKWELSVNPVVCVEQRKIQRGFVELTCTNTSPHCMDLLILWALFPLKLISLQGGKVRGHLALKSAENVFPEGSLIFLWCFVSEVCVCVSCRDLAFWKSEPWGWDFDIALNIAGILEYECGLPFNAFPKDPQEAQSLIYYSMSSPCRTGWGFMGGQCRGALLNLEVEMRLSARAGNGKSFLPD